MKSPRDGVVAEIMRRTRAQYHYAIRKLKLNAIALRRNVMAESIINNNSRDLWSEIRKVRNTTKTVSSTVICTSILLDTIEYYNENNTDCFLLLLDASKVLDRVEYVKLFKMVKDRNICPIVLRLLMNMYVNQKIQVRWNNLLSSQYHISNGVKQ